MKNFGYILLFSILLNSCHLLFQDEKLMLPKKDYTGNELRIDGYYYYHPEPNSTRVLFFYRNGVMIDFISYFPTTDLTVVDKSIADMYEKLKDSKYIWQVFLIEGSTIQCSGWGSSVGGGLPSYKCIGTIENDTTFRFIKSIDSKGREFEKNDVYHFRQFSPKPDSTNVYIK